MKVDVPFSFHLKDILKILMIFKGEVGLENDSMTLTLW